MIEEQQKSSTGVIVTIIIVGIIILAVISLIIIGVQKGWFKNERTEFMQDSKVLIDIIDYVTGEKISSDYTIKMLGFEKSGNHQSGVLSE